MVLFELGIRVNGIFTQLGQSRRTKIFGELLEELVAIVTLRDFHDGLELVIGFY